MNKREEIAKILENYRLACLRGENEPNAKPVLERDRRLTLKTAKQILALLDPPSVMDERFIDKNVKDTAKGFKELDEGKFVTLEELNSSMDEGKLLSEAEIFKIVRELAPEDYCQLALDAGEAVAKAQLAICQNNKEMR